jgi:hypothetical protein
VEANCTTQALTQVRPASVVQAVLLTYPREVVMFDAHLALTTAAQAYKRHVIRDAQTRKALADARALLAHRRPWYRRLFG